MTGWRTPRRSIVFGGATVSTVLIVLCMACLSLMGLSRARADHRIAQRAAETVRSYYEAEAAVETALSVLSVHATATPDAAGSAMADAAQNLGVQAEYDAASRLLTISADAGAQGMLVAQLQLSAQGRDTAAKVISYRVQSREDAQIDTTLPVYQE